MAGGSQGNLCLGGSIGRFLPAQSTAAGTFAMTVDLDAIPTPLGSVSVLSGETWNFQTWHRDLAGTSNFTEGASVLFERSAGG